jgi:hypothetical protein
MSPWKSIAVLLILLCGCAYVSAQPATPKTTCKADLAPASDADIALYKDDFKKAEELFRAQLGKDANDDDARAQLVRALLKDGKVNEAEQMATKFLSANPDSSAAETAMGRVFYRKGDMPDAYAHISRAVTLDQCNGRAHYMLGRIYALSSMETSAQLQYFLAHDLKPTDDDIQVVWMYWLPNKERIAPLSDYIEHSPYYNKDDENLVRSLQEAKAAESGTPQTCRAISATNETRIALEPVFSDANPGAMGYIGSATVQAKGPEDPNYPIRGWGLDISIEGERRRLQIITSVSGIVLSKSAAARLKPTQERQVTQFGIPSYTTHLDTIRIGDLDFKHCAAIVWKDSSISKDWDGLIGLDMFDNYLISIDASARQLRLSPLPPLPGQSAAEIASLQTGAEPASDLHDRYIPPGMSGWSRVYRTWSFWLVPTHVNKAGPERLFLLNTANWLSYVDYGLAKNLTNGRQKPGVRELETHPIKLDFAGINLTAQHILVGDFSSVSDSYGFDIAGFLGLQSFPNMILNMDYRDGLIQFVPDSKH